MLSVTLRHNVGYLVTYLRLLHVFSTNKYNAQISWLFQLPVEIGEDSISAAVAHIQLLVMSAWLTA